MSEASTAGARAEATGLDLEAMGVYDSDAVSKSAYARVLVVGPAKAGKTTCIASTAPQCLVLNCDGRDATSGAASHTAQKFLTIDVANRSDWVKARKTAKKLVAAGAVRTIMVDTASLLCHYIHKDLKRLGLENYDLWNALEEEIVGGYSELAELDAHLFVTAHMTGNHEDAAGILPLLMGQSKIKLAAMVTDWVLLDVDAGRKPHERLWLLGPQKEWTHSGRNVKRVCAVEATVPALFDELGITL